MRSLFLSLLMLIGLTNFASASLIPIAGYDITDAVVSGHGNWFHSYSGSIVNLVDFNNNTFAGKRANYIGGGSGTLNDGVIGASIGNTQLFMGEEATDGTLFDTTIFLTLSHAYTIDSILLYGGNITNNAIPGFIESVTVTLLKTDFTTVSETFSTTSFGINNVVGNPVNDRVDLTGSSLDGVGAYAVYLSGFTGPGDAFPLDSADNTFSQYGGWFSLTEIELEGDRLSHHGAVPEPASIATMAGPLLLGAIGFYYRRKRLGRQGQRTLSRLQPNHLR